MVGSKVDIMGMKGYLNLQELSKSTSESFNVTLTFRKGAEP